MLVTNCHHCGCMWFRYSARMTGSRSQLSATNAATLTRRSAKTPSPLPSLDDLARRAGAPPPFIPACLPMNCPVALAASPYLRMRSSASPITPSPFARAATRRVEMGDDGAISSTRVNIGRRAPTEATRFAGAGAGAGAGA
eukprot:30922-Pelagococcus_subviridis.AAC.1